MILLWAAFICLCASATGKEITYQTSFIVGPFTRKFGRRDYISRGVKTNQLAGTIFCVSSSGNGLEQCIPLSYKDHRVILQLDAYNYEIPAHRTPQLLQWRPVTNYDQTLAFAVVIAPDRCSVHRPRLSSKRHYNIRCPDSENKNAGLRIHRQVKPQIWKYKPKPKLIIPVYEIKDGTDAASPISRVYLFVNPVGMDFALGRSTGDGALELAPFGDGTSAVQPDERTDTIYLGVDDRRLPIATKDSYYVRPMCRFRYVSDPSYEFKRGLFGGIEFLCYASDGRSAQSSKAGKRAKSSIYCTREHNFGMTVKAPVRDGVVKMKVRPYGVKSIKTTALILTWVKESYTMQNAEKQ